MCEESSEKKKRRIFQMLDCRRCATEIWSIAKNRDMIYMLLYIFTETIQLSLDVLS